MARMFLSAWKGWQSEKGGGRIEEPKWTIMIRGKNLISFTGISVKYISVKQYIYLKKTKLLFCTKKSEIYIPKRQYSIFAGKVCITNIFIVQIHYNRYSCLTVLQTSNILQIDWSCLNNHISQFCIWFWNIINTDFPE